MAQVYSDPTKANNKWSLPDCEVFYSTAYGHDLELNEDGGREFPPGFYYWYCLPGCLPDSEPIGPFTTAEEAIESMREET